MSGFNTWYSSLSYANIHTLVQPSSSFEADMIKERKPSKSRAPGKGHKQIPGVAKESQPIARTRTGNVEFTPAKTHDMVRSLFDPTLKKSFLECWISLAILSNVVLCYFMATKFGASFTKKFFLWQYVFWRLCYNVGIGVVLHFQSNYETLTNFAKMRSLFSKKNQQWLARFCRFEIESKMPNTYCLEEYPEEFNVWLLFRQFVDLILMQDFTTYILFVVLSIPKTVLSSHTVSFALGVIMILFNVWVKVDAHRVVKDYAWYWGDFFFFQDSKLVFDGVFNVSPHPMYSIGYMGYYGLSLISGDYKVLLVSIGGHLLQFLFLKYCENPHIEKIYGSDAVENDNAHIDELLVKENPNYSKPLITKGLWFTNVDKLRLTDYFTILTVASIVLFTFFLKPSTKALFWATLVAKITTSLFISLVLHKQSTSKWFTRLFLKNGYTQVHSFYQWQFLYNYCLTVSYTLLILQTWSQFRHLESRNYTQIIFGFLLCWLQKWCDDEILTAISEFGWFYGDFFLTNYISSRKLNSRGIYRYLSNPERFLGVAGCWGAVLITHFSPYNLILAALWTAANIALVKLVEEPHVSKVYGTSERKSGVSKTLMGFKPIRRFSEIMDKMELRLVRHLTSNDSPFEEEAPTSEEAQWNEVVQLALQSVTANLAPNCEFKLGDGKCDTFIIPGPVEAHWKLPSKLYNNDDWIGLYKVFETGEDRQRTRVSSNGRWTGTNEAAFPYSGRPKKSIVKFQRTGDFVNGTVKFDHSLMFYEEGVYELRYHSGNTHKVLMISQPFRLSLPIVKAESAEELSEGLHQFLAEVHALDGNSFNPNSNRYLGDRFLKGLIKKASGVDLSVKYLRRINYDVSIIGKRVQEIKAVLENLE